MTVNELIQLLADHPADLRVVVNGYDDLSPGQLRVVKISLDTGEEEWVGKHGDADYLSQEKLAGLEVEEALVLRRCVQLRGMTLMAKQDYVVVQKVA